MPFFLSGSYMCKSRGSTKLRMHPAHPRFARPGGVHNKRGADRWVSRKMLSLKLHALKVMSNEMFQIHDKRNCFQCFPHEAPIKRWSST